MRKAKKFLLFLPIILLSGSILLQIGAFAAFTPKTELYSEAVYMVETETDTVAVAINENKKLMPASTTKIMTALVAFEKIRDFDATVDVTSAATNEFWEGNPNYSGPSSADLAAGQGNLTYRDCLYSLMVASACDSANVLAINIAGSIPAFVDLMNEKAAEIGCENTHFSNTHGLYAEDNYTTAKDLYMITRYAIDNYPGFMTICDTKFYQMPANQRNPNGYPLKNTNAMLFDTKTYFEGVHGVKTGSINEYYEYKNGEWDTANPKPGSRALVTTAAAKGSDGRGYRYITVTLGAPYYTPEGEKSDYSFRDHAALYDWAYSELVYTSVVTANEQVSQVDVYQGRNTDKVGVVAAGDYSTLLEKSLNKTTVSRKIEWYEDKLPVRAPQNEGYVVGEMKLMLDGKVISTIPLQIERKVELDATAFYIDKVRQVAKNPLFTWFCVLLGAEIVVMTIAHYAKSAYRRRVAEMNRRRRISSAPPKKYRRR